MEWQLHWLEAEADLGPWREFVAIEIEATRQLVARAMPVPRLDILIQRRTGMVIPEIGMVGRAYSKGLFALTLDPDNPHFATELQVGTLRRQVVHEFHHCLRMAGPGYGRTLGEALISEGLAGQFTSWLFGSPPEPWERAVEADVLRLHAPDATALQATDYNHAAWFFGVGGRHPRWLGYTLGYQLVGDWLRTTGGVDGDAWVNVEAEAVLAAARGQPDALCFDECLRDSGAGSSGTENAVQLREAQSTG